MLMELLPALKLSILPPLAMAAVAAPGPDFWFSGCEFRLAPLLGLRQYVRTMYPALASRVSTARSKNPVDINFICAPQRNPRDAHRDRSTTNETRAHYSVSSPARSPSKDADGFNASDEVLLEKIVLSVVDDQDVPEVMERPMYRQYSALQG